MPRGKAKSLDRVVREAGQRVVEAALSTLRQSAQAAYKEQKVEVPTPKRRRRRAKAQAAPEAPAAPVVKPKRKRATKAEMAARKAAQQEAA